MLRALLNLFRGQAFSRTGKSHRQSPRLRRTLPTLECLESRQLLSVTIPGFTLDSGGNLYNTTGGQPQLIDTGVVKFAIENNTVINLHADNTVQSMNTEGSGKETIGSAVTAFASAGNGDIIMLNTSGDVYEQWDARTPGASKQIGNGVAVIAIAGNGLVVELQSNGALWEQAAAGSSYFGTGPLGQGISSFAIAGNGLVVELQSNGALWEQAAAGSYYFGTGPLGQGISSFAIAGNGLVVELQSNGALWEQAAAGSYYFGTGPLGQGISSFAIAGNGLVVELQSNGALWEQAAAGSYYFGTGPLGQGISSFAIAGNGLVVELQSNGALWEQAAAGSYYFGTSPLGQNVTSVAIAGNGLVVELASGNLWEQAAAGSYYFGTGPLGQGISSFAIAGNGLVVELQSNGALWEQAAAGSYYFGTGPIGNNITAFTITENGDIIVFNTASNVYDCTPGESVGNGRLLGQIAVNNGRLEISVKTGVTGADVPPTIGFTGPTISQGPLGPFSPFNEEPPFYPGFTPPQQQAVDNACNSVCTILNAIGTAILTGSTTWGSILGAASDSTPIGAEPHFDEYGNYLDTNGNVLFVDPAFNGSSGSGGITDPWGDPGNSTGSGTGTGGSGEGEGDGGDEGGDSGESDFAQVTPGNFGINVFSSTTAGAAITILVNALNASGNLDTSYAGTVSFSSNDQQAGLPSSYTFTAADQGSHTFTLHLDTAGSQTITATDSADAIHAQAVVQVSPAAASHFTLAAPSSVTAGASNSVTVTAVDAFGNAVTGYTGTVSFSSSDQQAGLPSSYTFTAADQGQHTFAVTLETAGSQTLTATDSADASTGQASVNVNAAVTTSSVVYAQTTFTAVANTLTHSTEYFTNIIQADYQHFLDRAANAAELPYWLSRIQQGVTDEQIEAGFLGAPEYIYEHGGSGAGWVVGMYQDLLGRTPAPSEINYWVAVLNGGTTTQSVAYQFAASAEREGDHVAADYQKYLGRSASQSEVNYWVNLFRSGTTNEQVIAGFVGAPEYFQSHGSNATKWLDAAFEDILDRLPTDSEVQTSLGDLSS